MTGGSHSEVQWFELILVEFASKAVLRNVAGNDSCPMSVYTVLSISSYIYIVVA